MVNVDFIIVLSSCDWYECYREEIYHQSSLTALHRIERFYGYIKLNVCR